MKYLSIIYYDTSARFFCAIEDEVKKKDSAAEFLHLSIFPSGWMYMKSKGRNVQLLPWQIRRPYAATEADNAALDKVTYYHAAIGARYGIGYREVLHSRARDYLGTMSRIVVEFQPDAVLFSGDTRIACEALRYHLDRIQYGGKRFYFEQGPKGTTIFDSLGVNANCSFRESAAMLTGKGFMLGLPLSKKKFKRNPLFRSIDYAMIYVARLLGKIPPEWDKMSFDKLPKADYLRCIEHGRSNQHIGLTEILVALQVPDDANNIHHNPLGLSDAELVQWVSRASANLGLPVRVREHPLYRRRYSADMYRLLATSQRVYLTDSSLSEDLAKTAVVVTVNSMTGLDAYLRRIPVIVLGNAFYDHLPGIDRVQNEGALGTALAGLVANGLATRLNRRDPASIFAEMRAKYFIPGHFLDADLEAPHAIAEILTRDSDHSKV